VLTEKYPEQRGYHAGCHQVVEVDGDIIEVGFETAKWIKVMDSQWEIFPIKPSVS
jgi:hypothetical protein